MASRAAFRAAGLAARWTLFFLLLAGPAAAATIPYRTDGDLVALSERVVHARVVAVWSVPVPGSADVHTITRLAVLEDLTGIDDPVIDVREPGGEAGGRGMWVPGAPRFRPGQEVLVLLARRNGVLRTVALSYSTCAVSGTPANERLRRFDGVQVLGAPDTQ